MKTRRARSPCFQSIKRVIGFSLKLSDCYAKFGAARLSLFSFPTPGGCVCFAFIMIFILKFIFYFTIFCCPGASPPGKATAAGGDALRGGLRDELPSQGRPAPGSATAQPQGPERSSACPRESLPGATTENSKENI